MTFLDSLSPLLLLLLLILFCAVWLGTKFLVTWLTERQILDKPNARSSHATPKPRGGGLVLIPLLLLSWGLWHGYAFERLPGFLPVVIGAAILAAVSWLDDRRGLSPALRFGVQIFAVALGVLALDDKALIFQGLLPPLWDHLATGFLWLWFVNLFNFMDGIDGITGVEAFSIGLGLAVVTGLAALPTELMALALLTVAAVLGFLPWNWSPSKLFLGDVGAVPLGYLLAWLLILAASTGQWAAALILPLYYWSDASLTLIKRALRGEKVWQAHKQHAYQRAVRGGASHGQVALWILLCNLCLIALAGLAALGWPWIALAGAAAAVIALLLLLEHQARDKHNAPAS